jgi:hypothetical protein
MRLLQRFPKVDVVVIHTEMGDYSFEQTVRELKQIRHDVPVIGISPHEDRENSGADYIISSHDPHALLQLLAEQFEASISDIGDR